MDDEDGDRDEDRQSRQLRPVARKYITELWKREPYGLFGIMRVRHGSIGELTRTSTKLMLLNGHLIQMNCVLLPKLLS